MALSQHYQSKETKTSQDAESYHQTSQSVFRYLAYRDLPQLFNRFVLGKKALDYGCGTGVSSAYLFQKGFSVDGVDMSDEMIKQAQKQYPALSFSFTDQEKLPFKEDIYDLVFSSFVLFELSSKAAITDYLNEARRVLHPNGLITIITGSETMYSKDWHVLNTDFKENQSLYSGKQVKIRLNNPNMVFIDFYWTHADYLACFEQAGLSVIHTHKPLGSKSEPHSWKDELHDSPFMIYLLRKEEYERSC